MMNFFVGIDHINVFLLYIGSLPQVSWTPKIILKLVGIIWNRTSVEVVDMLSSTTVDLIRSERELENMHLYGV